MISGVVPAVRRAVKAVPAAVKAALAVESPSLVA
jgi:hypothetical protein